MIAWTNGCHGETEFPVQLFFKVTGTSSHIAHRSNHYPVLPLFEEFKS
jgi:hypothetical protein